MYKLENSRGIGSMQGADADGLLGSKKYLVTFLKLNHSTEILT